MSVTSFRRTSENHQINICHVWPTDLQSSLLQWSKHLDEFHVTERHRHRHFTFKKKRSNRTCHWSRVAAYSRSVPLSSACQMMTEAWRSLSPPCWPGLSPPWRSASRCGCPQTSPGRSGTPTPTHLTGHEVLARVGDQLSYQLNYFFQ